METLVIYDKTVTATEGDILNVLDAVHNALYYPTFGEKALLTNF